MEDQLKNIFVALDKNSAVPVYRQIEEQILAKIQDGTLKQKDRLPTERELSSGLGVSRGTVKKAYEGLIASGALVSVQGSGTYVDKASDTALYKPYNKLLLYTKELIEHGYSPGEIRMLLDMAMTEQSAHLVNAAAIDCNPEVLAIIKTQTAYWRGVKPAVFLLDEVRCCTRPEEIFDLFDIIFTTTTHYNDLLYLLPGQRERIIKAAISPDKETIIGLAGLVNSPPSAFGIVTRSARFGQIIENNLNTLGLIPTADDFYILGKNNDRLEDFLKNKKNIIMPPFHSLGPETGRIEPVLDFLRTGGRIINFNYSIEKGSLLHLEERIESVSRKELA